MIAQNPLGFDPYYLCALLAQEQGEIEEAKMLFKKILYLAPEFISTYMELGEIYARKNNPLAQIMWSSARSLLKKLPQDGYISMFGNSTAGDILQFVENRLSGHQSS